MYLCYISSIVLYFFLFFLINYCSFTFCIIIVNGLTACSLAAVDSVSILLYCHSGSTGNAQTLSHTDIVYILLQDYSCKHWFAWMELVFVHLLLLFILVSISSLARNASVCVSPPNSQWETSSVLTSTSAQSIKVRKVLEGQQRGKKMNLWIHFKELWP